MQTINYILNEPQPPYHISSYNPYQPPMNWFWTPQGSQLEYGFTDIVDQFAGK